MCMTLILVWIVTGQKRYHVGAVLEESAANPTICERHSIDEEI